MARPVGVTIISILDFLFAVLCILCAITSLLGGGFLAAAIQQSAKAQGAEAATGIVAVVVGAITVFCFIFAFVYLVLGFGLWKLKNWARILTIVVEVLWLLLFLLGLLGQLTHFNLGSFIWTMFWIIFACLIIWYLLKSDVKAAFK